MKQPKKPHDASRRPRASRMSPESQDAFKQRRERLYTHGAEDQSGEQESGGEEAHPGRKREGAGERQQRTRRIPVAMTEHMVQLAEAIAEQTQMEFSELLSQILSNALSVYAKKLNINLKKKKYTAEFSTEERPVRAASRERQRESGREEGGRYRSRSASEGKRRTGYRSRESGEGQSGGYRRRESGEGQGGGYRSRSSGTAAGGRGKSGAGAKAGGRQRAGGGKFGRKPGGANNKSRGRGK